MTEYYPRDLAGYGPNPPDARWPGGARLALQVVLNYEEGGENCVLHGDSSSEAFLSEIVGADAREGVRHISMESIYEYGSRVGVWRLKRLFDQYHVPVTVFAVGMAVERYPEPVQALHEAGHEICSHGYRWIDYQYVDESVEREHIQRSIAAIENAVGERPLGWYTGRTSPNTRRLVIEAGGFLYDADDYSDDLPHWNSDYGEPHLVVPIHAGRERYALRQLPGLQQWRTVLPVSEGQLRRALCRGQSNATHDVCWAALPPGWQAGTVCCTGTISPLRQEF